MGELREVEAQLMEGSAWAERSCSGGFTAASSSPAFGWSGGGVLGRGIAEQAKERVEKVSGVFVRLVRALGEGGGLSLGRATATARWRPCGGSGRRGEGGGTSARQRAVEEEQRDAWALARSRTWAETEQRS